MDRVYLLVQENLGGETYVDVYETEEKAQKELNDIKRRHRTLCEFEETENSCSWFDSNYNDRTTYIYIIEEKIQ